jgi:methyl-accepting chemotaxis protein
MLKHQAKAVDEQFAFFQIAADDDAKRTQHPSANSEAMSSLKPAGKAKPDLKTAANVKPSASRSNGTVQRSAGPARQMQTALATAVGQDWKEF